MARVMDPNAHLRNPNPEMLAQWAVEDCGFDAREALATLRQWVAELVLWDAIEIAKCYARAAEYLARYAHTYAPAMAA